MITKKQRAALIAGQKDTTVRIVNVISKSKMPAEEKVELVSFLLILIDVLDLEQERLDYEKLLRLQREQSS